MRNIHHDMWSKIRRTCGKWGQRRSKQHSAGREARRGKEGGKKERKRNGKREKEGENNYTHMAELADMSALSWYHNSRHACVCTWHREVRVSYITVIDPPYVAPNYTWGRHITWVYVYVLIVIQLLSYSHTTPTLILLLRLTPPLSSRSSRSSLSSRLDTGWE